MDSVLTSIDIPAFIVSALAGMACGLCGSILLLRKQAMMADALSHSILPGLALAYIITGTLHPAAMAAGAFISCLLAALCMHIIQRAHILSPNMALGIVLTSFFAAGVLMLETSIASDVHLDAEHALYGSLELIYWPDAGNLRTIPAQIPLLLILNLILLTLLVLRHNHIKLILSDPVFARSIGQKGNIISLVILMLCVLVFVACFEAVGAILVVALIICPAACAHLLTRRLSHHIALSALIGFFCGITGYFAGAILPLHMGFENSLNAAASISLCSGALLFIIIMRQRHARRPGPVIK